MTITIVMKKTRAMSLRVSELAYALVEAERARTKESQADVIERCVLQSLNKSSPEAIQLIRKYAAEDPTLAAIAAAIEASGGMPNAPGPRRRAKPIKPKDEE